MNQGLRFSPFIMVAVSLQGCQDRVRRYSYTMDGIFVGGYPVVFKEIPKLNYIFESATLEKTKVREATQSIAADMMKAVGNGESFNIIGPLTYVIPNLMQNVGETVAMDIGLPVDSLPKDLSDKAKVLEPFKCITVRVPIDDNYTKNNVVSVTSGGLQRRLSSYWGRAYNHYI